MEPNEQENHKSASLFHLIVLYLNEEQGQIFPKNTYIPVWVPKNQIFGKPLSKRVINVKLICTSILVFKIYLRQLTRDQILLYQRQLK